MAWGNDLHSEFILWWVRAGHTDRNEVLILLSSQNHNLANQDLENKIVRLSKLFLAILSPLLQLA